nr:MAG TPA: hypothetical protein [Caudoviricetes sp.]
MSYIFSRALVEAYLAANCSESAPSAPSNSNPIPQAYCSPGKMTAFSRLSRFGMTYAPLTDDHGAVLLTWYLEASRARTSAFPEKEKDWKGQEADCGQKWRESFAKFDRDSHSWKIPQTLPGWDLTVSSETWPKWGTMRNGVCWDLMPLDYPIVAPDYGFLPTMRACIAKHGLCWKRAEEGKPKGNLEDYLAYLYVKNGGKRVRGMCVSASFGGLMMGWPQKWTSLKPLAMGKYLLWRQLHSGFCSAES